MMTIISRKILKRKIEIDSYYLILHIFEINISSNVITNFMLVIIKCLYYSRTDINQGRKQKEDLETALLFVTKPNPCN